MAHILIAYKQFPAPSVGHAGGESLFRLMEALHRRGHRLTLVARIADAERRHLPDTEAICEAVYTVPHHRSIPGPRVLAFLRSYLALHRMVREVIRTEQPDFMHVETTQTAIAALGLDRPPASYRTQDVNWFLVDQRIRSLTGLRRLWARGQRWCFRSLEPWICRRYDLTLAISEGDRRLMVGDCDPGRLLVVPLTPAFRDPGGLVPAVQGRAILLFVGAMSRDHNQQGITWFLDYVWERIVAEVPEAQLYVVGGGPPESLIRRSDGSRVIVTGFVDDLAPWYRAATVFISPLLVAGGLLQKVMDAMAMGVPVVATSVCNHGIGAMPGVHLLTADSPDAFAAAVIELLRSPDRRAALGTAAQAFIASDYDLDRAVDQWDAAIRRLTS